MSNRQNRGGRAGFTLIEVLVALAILSLTLVPLLQIYSRAAGNAKTADLYVRASAVAESVIALAGVETALAPGASSGRAADVFEWTLTVRPYSPQSGTESGTGTEATMAAGLAVEIYEVEAVVNWTMGITPRSVTLKTLRVSQGAGP